MAKARLVVYSGIASRGVSYAHAVTSPGNFSALQTGYQEVPPVFTGTSGSCSVKIKSDGTLPLTN
jgi:hypothetical protein